MKQHHSIFPPAASLACALILMLAACTSDALDELPPAGTCLLYTSDAADE